MPLFRLHRGGLAESIATTVIVKDIHELKQYLRAKDYCIDKGIEIRSYPDPDNCFDARIGWYTQMVRIKEEDGKLYPVGFLSEPLI